jgi:hypothetical protein
MIISQAPVHNSLWRFGLPQNKNAMVRQRSLAYLDEYLFYEYLSQVFIPNLADRRRAEPFS